MEAGRTAAGPQAGGTRWRHVTHQFKKLFSQRMSWKAADEARRMTSQRRREDRRVPQQPHELELHDGSADNAPLPIMIKREEKERLILMLLRLKSDRDRRLLTLHLKGESVAAIAREMNLTYDAARKALSRAIEQARKLVAVSEQRRTCAI